MYTNIYVHSMYMYTHIYMCNICKNIKQSNLNQLVTFCTYFVNVGSYCNV